MTTPDTSPTPSPPSGSYLDLEAAIRDALYVARIPVDQAADQAGIPRTSLYRRFAQPGGWRLGELIRVAEVAGCTVRVLLDPLPPTVEHTGRRSDTGEPVRGDR